MTKENLNLKLIKSKLSEWRAKIEELEAKAHLMTEDESEVDQRFGPLKERYQEIEDYLAQLKTRKKEEAQDFEGDAEQHWSNLIQEFEAMATKYQ